MKKNKKNTKVSVAVLLLILAVALGVGWMIHRSSDTQKTLTNTNAINYGPPTKIEKATSESQKNESPGNLGTNENNPNTTTKRTITVNITTWDPHKNSFSLNGFAEGIIEQNGTCTLVLSRGATKVSESRSAEPNATNTTCGEITVDSSKLSVGTWEAVLKYSSPVSQGSSAPQQIEIVN